MLNIHPDAYTSKLPHSLTLDVHIHHTRLVFCAPVTVNTDFLCKSFAEGMVGRQFQTER